MISQEVIKVKEVMGYAGITGYDASPGSFFIMQARDEIHKTHSSVYTCREQVASGTSSDSKHLGFKIAKANIERVNQFFLDIRERLDRPLVPTFYKTSNNPNFYVVYIPPFWRKTACHRGFFTMFLRCAFLYYDGKKGKSDNALDNALYQYNYCLNIKGAIEAFFEGFTVPTFTDAELGNGVVSKFSNLSKADAKRLLRLPKTKKKKV
jgi:hypothetical protein